MQELLFTGKQAAISNFILSTYPVKKPLAITSILKALRKPKGNTISFYRQ